MAVERTCIGCRLRAAPDQLVRITVDDVGLVVSRHGPGRGAWLCRRPECFDQAARRRAFGRALRAEIDDEWIERLRVAFVRDTPNARG